jgi:hypothetical protein
MFHDTRTPRLIWLGLDVRARALRCWQVALRFLGHDRAGQ